MRIGIGYPTYAYTATYAGAFQTDYPASNLAVTDDPRRVAVFGPASGYVFTAVLAAASWIQLMTFVHHNAPKGSTYTIRLFSDANPDPVGNTAHLVATYGGAFWPDLTAPLADWPSACRPVYLQDAVLARSIHVSVVGVSQEWELGSFDVAGWWDWSDMDIDRSIGLDSRATVESLPGGVDHASGAWSPRVFTGGRTLVTDAELLNVAAAFAQDHGITKPFVFVDDADDPSSWPRRCFLAHNAALAGHVNDYTGRGSTTLNIEEHL